MRIPIIVYGFIVFLFGAGQSDGLSIDGSALRSGDSKQVQGKVAHIRKLEHSTFEVGASYAKTEGRDRTYEIYVTNETRLYDWFRIDSDARKYQSHDTLAWGVGTGVGPISVTGGARFEYKTATGDHSFGRAKASLTRKVWFSSVSCWLEGLHDGDNGRWDFSAQAKTQAVRHLYLAVRTQRIRSVSTDGISLGVKF